MMFGKRTPASWPPAIGYIRLETFDATLFEEHRQELVRSCQAVGLLLTTVFHDLGDDGTQLMRPGLNAVLTALQAVPGLVVMLPDLNHLSPHEIVRSPLLLAIHRAKATVLEARDTDGNADGLNSAARGTDLESGDQPA